MTINKLDDYDELDADDNQDNDDGADSPHGSTWYMWNMPCTVPPTTAKHKHYLNEGLAMLSHPVADTA